MERGQLLGSIFALLSLGGSAVRTARLVIIRSCPYAMRSVLFVLLLRPLLFMNKYNDICSSICLRDFGHPRLFCVVNMLGAKGAQTAAVVSHVQPGERPDFEQPYAEYGSHQRGPDEATIWWERRWARGHKRSNDACCNASGIVAQEQG